MTAKSIKKSSAKSGFKLTVGMKKVTFVSFDILEYGKTIKKDLKVEEVAFTMSFAIEIAKEERLAGILSTIKALHVKEGNGRNIEGELCELKIHCDIFITNIDEVTMLDSDTNDYYLIDRAAKILIGICVSTARGVFLMSAANTHFKNAVIPILNQDIVSKI